jgi:hypothetical protein
MFSIRRSREGGKPAGFLCWGSHSIDEAFVLDSRLRENDNTTNTCGAN